MTQWPKKQTDAILLQLIRSIAAINVSSKANIKQKANILSNTYKSTLAFAKSEVIYILDSTDYFTVPWRRLGPNDCYNNLNRCWSSFSIIVQF